MQRFHKRDPTHPACLSCPTLKLLLHVLAPQTYLLLLYRCLISCYFICSSDFMLFVHLLQNTSISNFGGIPRHTQILHAALYPLYFLVLIKLCCNNNMLLCLPLYPVTFLSHWTRIPCFIYLLSQVLCIKLGSINAYVE